MDRLVKIHQDHWNERLEISKITKFGKWYLLSKRYSSAKLQNFTNVCLVGERGQVCIPTIQMSVKYLSIVTDLQYTVLSNLKCLKKPALLIKWMTSVCVFFYSIYLKFSTSTWDLTRWTQYLSLQYKLVPSNSSWQHLSSETTICKTWKVSK